MSKLENREVGITEESEQSLPAGGPATVGQVPAEELVEQEKTGGPVRHDKPESFVTPRKVT